jgi:hypothetical protein
VTRIGFFVWLAVSASALSACDRAEPPTRPEPETPKAAAARARPAPPATTTGPARPLEATPSLDAGSDGSAAGVDASADAAGDAGLDVLRPPLVGDDGKTLPQTEERPSVDSTWFKAGIAALFRAIQDDDPSGAEPLFFPVEKPARDWKFRLIANFRRDVHDYHKKLGKRAPEAKLVGLELAEKNLRWMKPGSEGNKLGYFRVTHSRLRYELDGQSRSLDVTSFISWRGEWYLVHLNGFK